MKILCLILCAFPVLSYAQLDLPEEHLKIAEMLAVSENNIEGIQNIRFSLDPNDPDCPAGLKQAIEGRDNFVVMEDPFKENDTSKWKVSIRTSMTGPKQIMTKTPAVPHYTNEIQSKLNSLIDSEYGSYDDRLKAVGDACKGMNDLDKITMSSLLARRLSGIYDYGRANGGSDAAVSSEDQWKALKSGSAMGVCRDASLTVSQFLLACGFDRNQVAIKSYRTQNSGHQVTSIMTPDGEYTINWGELYNQNSAIFAAPDPANVNTGLSYTLYDPETGKIIETRRTELADALKYITGGNPKDPFYTPEMIVAEAAYGGYAAKVFMTETERGESVQGAAATYNSRVGDERSFTELSAGMAYARSSRDVVTGVNQSRELTQDIAYIQAEYKAQKAFPLFSNSQGKVTIAPQIGASFDMNAQRNLWNDNRSTSIEQYMEGTVGATAYYDSNRLKAYLSGNAAVVMTPRMYNNEAGGSQFGAYVDRYVIEAGASYEGSRIIGTARTNMVITNLERQNSYAIGATDKQSSTSCEAVYSVYDRTFGTREDYLISRCSRSFSVQNLGTVAFDTNSRISLNKDRQEVIFGVGASLKFR